MKTVFILIWTILVPVKKEVFYQDSFIWGRNENKTEKVTHFEEFASSATLLAYIAGLPDEADKKVYEGKERRLEQRKVYSFGEEYQIYFINSSSMSIVNFSTGAFMNIISSETFKEQFGNTFK